MIKTAMLMAAMTALFGFAGTMLGGFEGLLIAIILAIAVNLLPHTFEEPSYLNCTKRKD